MADKISVVINSLNEAKNLPQAISSVKSLADEIVVVDMASTDGSAEVAKKLGAKVFSHEKINYVEPARNFGISKTTGDWILVLDPDEEISPSLSKKIKDATTQDAISYYRIARKNIVFGKWIKHSRWWPDYNIRFFKKGAVSWNEVIHAVPMTEGVGGDFEAKEELSIIHHHYDSIDQYLERMIRYTTVQSGLRVKEGYKFTPTDLITKPADEFLSRFFAGSGYKDGLHGLSLALLQSFSELVLYLKIWQAQKFEEKELNVKEVVSALGLKEKDLHFWVNDALYKETGNFGARIKRKLRI